MLKTVLTKEDTYVIPHEAQIMPWNTSTQKNESTVSTRRIMEQRQNNTTNRRKNPEKTLKSNSCLDP
jgi:hypothetical protein